MSEGIEVARRATRDIEAWLHTLSNTCAVRNVENNPDYQNIDVDLLWTTTKQEWKVEIKGDRLHHTGNFFFEVESNHERGTPGCFLYTQADLLFYYFVVPRDLYILPMPATRDWFKPRMGDFRKATTTTPIGRRWYTTVGRLVPISAVERAISSVMHYRLPGVGRETRE
jgi:hypothetical protein